MLDARQQRASARSDTGTNARSDGSGDTVRMPIPDLGRRDRAEVEFNRSTQLLVLGSGRADTRRRFVQPISACR